MSEFRYQGINICGKPVQGIISAANNREGKKKIKVLAGNKGIKITNIQKKKCYLYRVRKENEKYITGEQTAYTPEEVERALKSMDFQVLWVKRKLCHMLQCRSFYKVAGIGIT